MAWGSGNPEEENAISKGPSVCIVERRSWGKEPISFLGKRVVIERIL